MGSGKVKSRNVKNVKSSARRNRTRGGLAATELARGFTEALALIKRTPSPVIQGVMGLVFLVLAWQVVQGMMTEAQQLDIYRVDPSRVACSARPDWLDPGSPAAERILREVRGTLARFKPTPIFNDTLIRCIERDVCRDCPWVRQIVAVKRSFPAQLKLQLRLRRPVAFFFRRSSGFFVDRWGVVIDSFPAASREAIAAGGLPVVMGADFQAAPRAGKAYSGEALLEGAAIADELGVLHDLLGDRMVRVTTIDVSGFGRGESDDAVLVTDEGVRLFWGRSGRSKSYRKVDPSVQAKAHNLELVLRERPGLAGVDVVELAFDKPSYYLKTD